MHHSSGITLKQYQVINTHYNLHYNLMVYHHSDYFLTEAMRGRPIICMWVEQCECDVDVKMLTYQTNIWCHNGSLHKRSIPV